MRQRRELPPSVKPLQEMIRSNILANRSRESHRRRPGASCGSAAARTTFFKGVSDFLQDRRRLQRICNCRRAKPQCQDCEYLQNPNSRENGFYVECGHHRLAHTILKARAANLCDVFEPQPGNAAHRTSRNDRQSGSLSTMALIDRIAACTEAAASPALKAASATAAAFKWPITASFSVS